MKRHKKPASQSSTQSVRPLSEKALSHWHIPPDRATNPMIPWLHALAAMGDEHWEEAIVAFQRLLALEQDPEAHYLVWRNLSGCYHALERYDEALAALDETERSIPNNPDLVRSRGVIYACAGRLPEAIATFERFARRWPRQARLRDTRETIHELQRIQHGEIPPGSFLVRHLQEQIHHHIELGEFHLVERKARRMIAADPNRPEGHFEMGMACLEQGRYQEGLDSLLAAHSCDPDDQLTLYNIGQVYLEMGDPAQAIPWWERALRQNPRHLATLHQLGLACERLGRRDEAVTWWRRALQIDPSYELAQRRLHEVDLGPAPVETLLTPQGQQLREMTPIVKTRMLHPQVHRNGGITLTYDGEVGFVLEDTENVRNAAIYAGGPFRVVHPQDEDILDLMGTVKLILRMVNAENTRDVRVLAYYTNRPIFGYRERFAKGKAVESEHDGQFVVTEVPRFFKLYVDSDLDTPYGNPMKGTIIYLNQHPKPGILINTMGLLPTSTLT